MEYYRYFQTYDNYFWQWEENAEVIAIPGGNTIAYRDFVIEVLKKLSPQGMPPFGSLLLAIVATNGTGKVSLDSIEKLLRPKRLPEDSTLDDVLVFLNILTALPNQYKEGTKRILLFQALFQDCHNSMSAKKAEKFLEWYASRTYDLEKFASMEAFSTSRLNQDLRILALLSKKFPNENAIVNKIASLPEIPEEVYLPEDGLGEEQGELDLIDQLIANNKTFPIGSLVKRIWSGLNIPFHNSLPSRQPLGGVSDLTNKGDFDKLLISEFANDDLVFLTRLANNEALYLQREIPPASNNLERVILIDISLKNWGTPKVLAFATMLAIARHPKTDIKCVAYGIGDTYYPLFADTVHSVIESLQILEGSLSAARGLSNFFKEFPDSQDREVFLITTLSALQQAEMLKVVNDNYRSIHYWIHTEADGSIEIFKRQQNSKRHVQHMQLPLDTLWQKEKREKVDGQLEKLPQYPILFRNSFNIKKILSTSDGERFQITPDKDVLRHVGNRGSLNEKGWELVYENLPFLAGEFEIGVLENNHHVLLMFNLQNKEITLLDLAIGTKKSVFFHEWKSSQTPGFVFHLGRFYHSNPSGIWSIALDGTVEKDNLQNVAILQEREKELKELKESYSYSKAVLKNVKKVFINQLNNLVFNFHELRINQGSHITLEKSGFLDQTLAAKKTRKKEFTFPDGSRVEIKSSGMILLKSSNPEIPTIYVPSVPEDPLGVATDEAFAGNEYYYPEILCKLFLMSADSNKLSVVKEIKDVCHKSLSEAKELADNTPALIGIYTNSKAEEVKKKLEDIGAKVKLAPELRKALGEREIEKIPTTNFFERYIDHFISNIQANGVKA